MIWNKKISSRKIDFPHLLNRRGPKQAIYQLNKKNTIIRLAQGKQNLRAALPKGKLETEYRYICLPVGILLPKGVSVLIYQPCRKTYI